MANNRKTSPGDPHHHGAREGNYKNIEEPGDNPSYFDDDYDARRGDRCKGLANR